METNLLLETLSAATPLPACLRPGERAGEPGRHLEEMLFGVEAVERLKSVAPELAIDICSIVTGAWGILLSQYSGQEDVAVGVLVRGLTSTIQPIRLRVDGGKSLTSWLSKIAESLSSLHGISNGPAHLDTAIIFSAPPDVYSDRITTDLPLVLYVDPTPVGEMRVVVDYQGDRFCQGAIPRILCHLKYLLDSIVANAEHGGSILSVMSENESKDLLIQWNTTGVDYPRHKCIPELFEEQVHRTPGATAVIFRGQHLSYQELENQGNRLAWRLRELGAGPEVIVAICIERSLDMIVGLLGVLKAGAAYLPLDPAFPPERLQFMLEDSGAHILITQDHLLPGFPQQPAHTITIGSPEKTTDSTESEPQSQPLLATDLHSDHLAYLIYTSGSTGKPKGVMVEHRQVGNFFAGMDRVIGPEPGVWLAVTSISFDISALELLWTLTRGFTVILQANAENLTTGGEYSIEAQIGNHRVTHLQCTPSMARFLVSNSNTLRSLRCLRKLVLGGEALPSSLVAQLRPAISGDILNLYGPTETTIWSAWHRVLCDEAIIPIGRPVANTQIHILNKHLQPVPIGAAGEIFIGGEGVARGYLNRPELTEERFLPDPFQPGTSERIYKTGDLARYRFNGDIEFLGRVDNQIKILGFRIEPEEIEAVLDRHPGVAAVAVVAREQVPGEFQLVAYVVLAENPATVTELRVYLQNKLPPQMIPSAFVILESLPSTPNGKVDKKALASRGASKSASVATSGDGLERLLSTTWREALDVESIGMHDNFFDLGANSLVMAEVASKLRDALNIDIPLLDLFKYPTVGSLLSWLSRNSDDDVLVKRGVDRGRSRKETLAGQSRGAQSPPGNPKRNSSAASSGY